MVDTIAELTELSRKLNQKSDKLNEIISSINEKLAKLNFGLEVWVSDPIQASNLSMTDEDGKPSEPHCDAVLLGYCRTEDDKWQLAFKEATLVYLTGECSEVRDSLYAEPLLKARREIRAKAMRLIPKLLDELRDEGMRMLKSIERAEESAASL